jgi:hypothetical protein
VERNDVEQRAAELAAIRIILSNLVARVVRSECPDHDQVRLLLSGMNDECKLAAQHVALEAGAAERRDDVVSRMLTFLDEFFKSITIR